MNKALLAAAKAIELKHRELYGAAPMPDTRALATAAIIAFIAEGSKHDFWGAGEQACPKDIKAGNGELHTLRCKKCGQDNPKSEICTGDIV